jgi:CIC family chloride channel protein
MGLDLMLLLLVLKLLAVTTSYSSGNAGGIFGPSLFIGAMLGGVVGTTAHRLLPDYTASAGAYALVGMGAVFAGVVRAPMTSVLMIFEMTQDYAVIVPLMIANLVSLFISSRLQRQPIYAALAVQDGIHLPKIETRHRHRDRQVTRVMRPAPNCCWANLP